nr:hypothetical protein [Tanacetum cinerariifolium]
MVLRVKKKLFIIEQPISPAPPADSKYLRSGMRFMMLIIRLLVLCSEAATPQVMVIQGGRIQRANKNHLMIKGRVKGKARERIEIISLSLETLNLLLKEHSTKNDICHHCKKVGHYKRNCPAYLTELIKKKKQVGTTSSSDIFVIELFSSSTKSWIEEANTLAKSLKIYMKACGIVQQLSPPHTLQHNRVSERRNHTLLDMVRSMMNLTTFPLSFWDYALESAALILNMVLTKKVDKTPYELWYGKVPNLPYLKVWGCKALVRQDTPEKLQQRSVKCIFIGYPKETMVGGRENLKKIQDKNTSPFVNISEIPMEVEGFEPPHEEEVPIRRSARTRRAHDRLCLNVEVDEHSLGDLNEPTNYKAAMLDLNSNKWLDAINAEMQSMKDNQVWRLVDLPPNGKTVGSKWISKKKTDMDGNFFGHDKEDTHAHIRYFNKITSTMRIPNVPNSTIKLMLFLSRSRGLPGFGSKKNPLYKDKMPSDCLKIIESKSKVRQLRAKAVVVKVNSNSSTPAISSDVAELKDMVRALLLDKKNQSSAQATSSTPAPIKAVESNCVTCGGTHSYQNCPATSGNVYQDNINEYVSQASAANYNQRNTKTTSTKSKRLTLDCCETIFKYLRNTKDMFLVYGGNPEAKIRVDCDYDDGFKTDRDDTKSQKRYVFILNGRRSRLEKLQAKYYCNACYIS